MAENQAQTPTLPRRTALKQNTLSESVYQEIRTRLQRGQVGIRDRILDHEVADEFGCTRMPVRQALLRLVNDGYLVGTTRGFVVPTLTANDIRELFELRRLLEPSAAAATVPMLGDKEDAALRQAYQKARKAYEKRDTAAMIRANIEFRDVWLDAVPNARLQSTIRRFADHVQQVRLATLDNRPTQKVVVEGMRVLLEGFVERDPKRIKTAMMAFTIAAEQWYFALIGGPD
ncbi:MAG: GntR family transcriptional regulator [Bordetella sp.]|uniref:GntR family transcriptional regulator n=1 Tax=Bordetella sp. TaxID=28081 RepID=UPI003F7C50ED